jgi:hypothetical protein
MRKSLFAALLVLTTSSVCFADLNSPPDALYMIPDQRTTMFGAIEKGIAQEEKDAKDDKAKALNKQRKAGLEALAARCVRMADTPLQKESIMLLDGYVWAAKIKLPEKCLLSVDQHTCVLKCALYYSEYFALPKYKKGDPKGLLSVEIEKVCNPLSLKLAQGKELTVREEIDLLTAFVTVSNAAKLLTPAEIHAAETAGN